MDGFNKITEKLPSKYDMVKKINEIVDWINEIDSKF